MADIPVLIDGEEIYVEVAEVYGSQKTGIANRVMEGTGEAFERAMKTIRSISKEMVDSIANLNEASRPEEFSLEFGVRFKMDGSVVIASTSGEATLTVKMLFKPKLRDDSVVNGA